MLGLAGNRQARTDRISTTHLLQWLGATMDHGSAMMCAIRLVNPSPIQRCTRPASAESSPQPERRARCATLASAGITETCNDVLETESPRHMGTVSR